MNVQELEPDADLRIRFATIKDDGTYGHHADEEYNGLFAEMPEGWECTPEAVETRPAWQLSHDEIQQHQYQTNAYDNELWNYGLNIEHTETCRYIHH